MYREMPQDAMQPHDTWIIAFCPDTDSFFVTNQRAFFWESEEEFESEEAGIFYFEHQVRQFVDIENELMIPILYGWKTRLYGWKTVDKIFLENTNKWYECD